ncbi:alpha/beta fold hydrolase [Nonomuraea sediminis]|uniref:alpha/beta fold hydrolase n=1 Tax=Nonomuraea sediminis TaxID=2835864 RepID=UPI001BDCA1E0|nr:alpha/beta fold hydrolase [Nonomuraea sediminis]
MKINYSVHGTATALPPLLLTHGYGSSSAMWTGNLAALGADRRVITWDIRGHGRTECPDDPSFYSQDACVDDMVTILDACGAERAVLGGLSLGGYLSLAFLPAHPERVAALVLCDTGPGFKDDRSRERWNGYADKQARTVEPRGLALAARGILTQRDDRVIRSLPDVKVPTLIVVGADDTPFLAAADYMAGKIPGAVKVVIPGAGHEANIDRPELFNRAVAGFLAALPAQ